MKNILPLSFVALTSLGASLPNEGLFCESVLTSNIRTMIDRLAEPLVLLTDLQPQVLSLPQVEDYFARGKWPPLQMRQDDIVLKSDLGLSLWHVDELADWSRLVDFLENDDLAQQELSKISETKGYCTPGVLPAICESLRRSRAARKAALRQMDFIAENFDGQLGFALLVKKLTQVTYRLHEKQDLIRFPWGTDARYLPDGLAPAQAKKIFRVFMREALIRHSLFYGLDDQMHRADQLSLETRLLVASFPFFYRLIPFFMVHPFELAEEFTIGGDMRHLTLPTVKWKFESANGKMPLFAKFNVESSFLSLAFPMDLDDPNTTFAVLQKIKLDIQSAMQSLVREFQQTMQIETPISFQTHFYAFDYLDVEIQGLSKWHRILFYYFLVERVPKYLDD